jgi:SRSO17 transposase
LLSDLPRKSVEPLALASGTTVRTLQVFLANRKWDHDRVRSLLHQELADQVRQQPHDGLGTIGVIDETSCRKWGDQTPGVQRQYLGCVGKIDNGIVTVHVGVAKGPFQALLDAELFLPESWAAERERCRNAGIPDTVVYRPKWKIAFDQLVRLAEAGQRFDWLTFDEYYGSKVPFLNVLTVLRQKFVGEVPVNFAVSTRAGSRRADDVLTAGMAKRGERFRLKRKTTHDVVWRATERLIHVGEHTWRLIVAINEATAEVKYFVTNDLDTALKIVLRVAFRRATIEHSFRLGKQEVGLMHFEGRQYQALDRHLLLALLVLAFVAVHTERLRGGKSTDHPRTSMPRPQRALRPVSPTPLRPHPCRPNQPRHPIPAAA